MRTRRGLPFVYTKYMNMILKSVISRVQRDSKVTLCHHLWMKNHPHIILVAKDKRACTQFYGEVQKQLTDAIKRLCGLSHLSLWKKSATSVIPYYDIETVCYRIGYLYANPARANQVGTIAQYPGVSSYQEFLRDVSNPLATHVASHPWIRMPLIEALSSRAVSRLEDLRICNDWKKSTTEFHELVIQPNTWMRSFGIVDPEQVEETNQKIVQYLTGLEQEAREKRKKKNQKVMGQKRLLEEPIDLTYQPKKPTRRIFVHSLDPELRAYLIEKYQEFCDACKQCYERWKLGDFAVRWPDGAFLPSPPHTRNNFQPYISNVY